MSRSISQGPKAGLISLAGVAVGFIFYVGCAAFGITALLMAVPYAYDALRYAGALYLLYMAWQAVRPVAVRRSRCASCRAARAHVVHHGAGDQSAQPKIAVMYVSLLPQFIQPDHGSVLTQSLALGMTQVAVSLSVNALIALMAGSIAGFLAGRPLWMVAQRWLMGTVLAGLAVRMALESRR